VRLHDRITLAGLLVAATCGLLPPAVAAQETGATRTTEEYGQLDFWVGEWDVFGSDSMLAGTNLIEV
jgi:hypothetical protein